MEMAAWAHLVEAGLRESLRSRTASGFLPAGYSVGCPATHLVHHDHCLAAPEQRLGDRTADEAGAARDKDRSIALRWAECWPKCGGGERC